MYRISMFSHLSAPKVLHSFSILPCQFIPFSLIPVISCIHEFRDLSFLLLTNGHHSTTTTKTQENGEGEE